jgi:hypothetical protein
MVFAADEYYLLAGRPMPAAAGYEGFPQVENGVGMAAEFAAAFRAGRPAAQGAGPGGSLRGGFFASVDGVPAYGYRAERVPAAARVGTPVRRRAERAALPVTVLSGRYGAAVLRPLLDATGFADVEVLAVDNELFGGNIAVTGLIGGDDVARVLSARAGDTARRYLLPDVCLSDGRFLDGTTPEELPCPVEVVETDGAALRRALSGAETH